MVKLSEPITNGRTNGSMNKLDPQDAPAHDWYRFVLSFPPHLVRDYLHRFGVTSMQTVLDPFCGTGTVLVECKKQGIPNLGVEATPVGYLVTKVKTDWSPDPAALAAHARAVAEQAYGRLHEDGVPDEPPYTSYWSAQHRLPGVSESSPANGHRPLRQLPPETDRLLLKNSISPRPLHKTLVLLESIEAMRDDRFYGHERVALAKALTGPIGNLHFGPEVGVGKPKSDAPVIASWLAGVERMASDLLIVGGSAATPSQVYHADSRNLAASLPPHSVDAIITSPPYPNEKDYSRTTRLETVLLGYLTDRNDLRRMKQDLLRSNTRGVYRADLDDTLVDNHPEISRIADAIEARRIELGKTSGFERLYPRVTKLYFGGMLRHLQSLKEVLRPGAQLAYVVGDQASYLRVMIRTGQILADLASSVGYECVSIDLFRTRLATATREQLREEVVVLRWPG